MPAARHWGGSIAALALACAPTRDEPIAARPQAPEYTSHDAPATPLGEPGDQFVEASSDARWIAVCRDDRMRLIAGAGRELEIDVLEATDPRGRFVVFVRAGV